MTAALRANKHNSRTVVSGADTGRTAGVISTPVCSNNGCLANLKSPRDIVPAALFSGLPALVTYEQAKQWAVRNGMCKKGQALNLKAVNMVRKLRGLPPFILKAG